MLVRPQRHWGLALAAIVGVSSAGCTRNTSASDSAPQQAATIWATGQRVTPAGTLVRLTGDMPLRIAPSTDGTSMLIVTGGYHDHSLEVIDPEHAVVRQHIPLGKAWAGLAVDGARGAIYVSGGGPVTDDMQKDTEVAGLAPAVRASLERPIIRLSGTGSALTVDRPLAIPNLADKDRFIAGIAADPRGHLFVINFQDNSVYKVDAATDRVLARVRLGNRPFQLALAPGDSTLAVANWGDQSVSLLSAATLKETARVPVGVHPTDLTYAADGRLFVANAESNSVSVIRAGLVVETVITSLHPNDPVGSTPNGLAVSADSRLYVANADNNDIAVIDIHEPGHSRVLGFIPTGWDPTALALTPDGGHLVVGLAKGIDSRPNWPARDQKHAWKGMSNVPFDFTGNALTGYAEVIAIPDAEQLAAFTHQVEGNLPVSDHEITATERETALAAFHDIKHVVFIIRENRTYDQVLGDDPRGDGDKELAYLGQSMTPNAHALAQQTPLLDRYFVEGVISQDGHQWANSAYSTAYNERATASWRGFPGSHDTLTSAANGNGHPEGPRGFAIAVYPNPDNEQRLVRSPAGYLWQLVGRAGLSYYNYGEFGVKVAGASPVYTDQLDIDRHTSRDWKYLFEKSDAERGAIFARDLKAAERSGQWSNFIVISMPWDHTVGLMPGLPTPEAMVADNDLGLGRIVEALSHSSFWASSAIFVTEDDAADGPDHFDAHRSVGFVISPYVKAGFVDHTPYTMTSMVRTMEVILGLPPMTQHDRDATPMYRLFQAKPMLWTYTTRPETVDLNALNPKTGPLAEASAKLDFSGVDRADPRVMNEILWAAFRPGVPMPAPVRRSFDGSEDTDIDQ